MNIIYVPLDERPCNALFPVKMAEANEEINILTAPEKCYGYKKESANIEAFWQFVQGEAGKATSLIASLDMLVYGGLLPSRLHTFTKEEAIANVERLRQLKNENPHITIYAFSLIMRTPKYNSSDEEPDYYEEYGERIFKRAFYNDKKNRVGLTNEEEAQLQQWELEIPTKHITDYETRRAINVEVNEHIIQLVKEGVIHFLAIPQDDSAEFGYTAIDQKKVIEAIKKHRVQTKVYMYPGADEVGASLLARAYNEAKRRRPKIYPMYSSTLGPTIVPLYEDRILNESLKYHVLVTNSVLTNNMEEADYVIAINSAGKVMQEAREQEQKDVTYSSFRNLLAFVMDIEEAMNKGKKVMVADVAFANGGDIELIQLLDEFKLLDRLISYKGWNTNCNTLGTTIGAALVAEEGHPKVVENLLYHLFDDVLYQSLVRFDIVENVLPNLGLNYFDLGTIQSEVVKIMEQKMNAHYNNLIQQSFNNVEITELQAYSPWNRMFEVGIHLKTEVRTHETICNV